MTAQGTYAPVAAEQYEDANGNPAVSYRLFTYLAGTSTKVNTYADVLLSSANANPLTLASDARPTVMLTPGISYKFVLALPGADDPPASVLWTRDNIGAVSPTSAATDLDVSGTAGENLAAGDAVYLSDGTGGTTAGRWYRTDADATASSTIAQAIGFAPSAVTSGATGTIRRGGVITGLSGLVAGTLYYISATAGGLTTTAPTNARAILQADTTTTGVILTGEPYASATLQGVVSTGAQTFAGVKAFASAPVLTSGETFVSGTTLSNYIFARCTSDLTKNANITPSNVTGLAFAVGASETWAFRFVMRGVSAVAANFRITLTGPAAPTSVWFGILGIQDTAGAAGVAAFAAEVFSAGTALDQNLVVSGLLRNGANAGTVQLQMAQRVSTGSNTIIYADSYVIAERVG